MIWRGISFVVLIFTVFGCGADDDDDYTNQCIRILRELVATDHPPEVISVDAKAPAVTRAGWKRISINYFVTDTQGEKVSNSMACEYDPAEGAAVAKAVFTGTTPIGARQLKFLNARADVRG